MMNESIVLVWDKMVTDSDGSGVGDRIQVLAQASTRRPHGGVRSVPAQSQFYPCSFMRGF